MEPDDLTEPIGGGHDLSPRELENICGAFDLFTVFDVDGMPTLHHKRHGRTFTATTKFGHKFGGWVGSHADHGHDLELRLALGLPEGPLRIRRVFVKRA